MPHAWVRLMGPPRDWMHGLLRAEAFPHEVLGLELLETHISWVVLTGAFAYKIKKPVDFGFVDFSTLELRERACRDEVRLNRRWGDTIYLDVVPVTGTHDAPRIGGPGAPIEFAVKMRQFDQDLLLSRCVDQGRLNAAHLERFALDLARFHQRVAGSPGVPFGTPEAVVAPVMENFDPLLAGGLPDEDRALVERIREYSATWFAQHEALLAQRHAGGFVREGHGDLHLNNMLLVDGRIDLFDCLEFSAELRWGDVMSEIAFLVMDLENRARQDLARRFLNAYIEHSGDHAGLAVLPFYMAYRAMVRAKVDQLTRKQAGQEAGRDLGLLRELERYLDEAAAYAHSSKPRLAVMSGVSGTGKTHHSLRFIERGFIRIRSDFERKRLAGSPLHAPVQGPAPDPGWIPPASEVLYAREFTRRTYDALLKRAEACLLAGFSVLIDATCLRSAERRAFITLAQRLDLPVRLFVLEDAVDVLEERIRRRQRERADLSDADVRILHKQLEWREPLGEEERGLAEVIDGRVTDPGAAMAAWLDA